MSSDSSREDDWPEWYASQGLDEAYMSVAPIESAPVTTEPDGERYQKLALLGMGGMGRVWLGWDNVIARHVAIKEPLGESTALQIQHLRREVMLTAKLDHPGIVAVHDIVHEQGSPLFVMALVRGKTLDSHLQDHPGPAHAPPNSSLIRHLLTLCEVIAHAHSCGIIHRDLTPRNILLEQDGTCRVIDWGMALTHEEASSPSGFAGTPGFMAPEQRVFGAISASVDIWGLGATLHAILYGRPPEESPITHDASVIGAICAKALHHAPQDRYASAMAMRHDLLSWFEGRRVEAFDTTPWKTARHMFKRYRTPIIAGCIGALTLAGVIAVSLWRTALEADRARLAEQVALTHESRAQRARLTAVEQADHAQRATHRLLLEAADEALERGDVLGARTHWRAAHTHPASPAHVGMAMRLDMIPEITLNHTRDLFDCKGQRILTNVPALQLCKLSPTAFQGWSTAQTPELMWQFDIAERLTYEQNKEVKAWRLTPDNRLVLQINHNGFITIDVATGQVESHRLDRGRFASHDQAHLLNQRSLAWLDFEQKTPCKTQVIQAQRLDDLQIYLCKEGGVIAQHHDARLETLYNGQAGKAHHYAYVPQTQAHWVSSSAGHIWPLHAFDRRVALGSPIRQLTSIPSTSYILVRDWSSTWRVLDTAQGDWIASFGPGTEDVRPTVEGSLQVIHQGSLQIWELPRTSTIRRYRAEHGLADVAWSHDGTTLVAGDGGAHVHWFKPFLGVRATPLELGPGVVKSVTSLREGGFAATTSLPTSDDEGMVRVSEVDGKLVYKVLAPDVAWAIVARRVESLADGTLAIISIAGSFGLFSPGSDEGTYIIEPQDESTALRFHDLDTDETRTHALAMGKKVLHFFGPRDTLGTQQAPEGVTYGAIASDGSYALATPDGIWIYDQYDTRQGHITTQTRVTSIDWRSGSHHLITGHIDGALHIWDTRTGEQLAYVQHHQGRVSSVASSPDGRHLASASWDTTIRVLSLDTLEHLSSP